MSHLDVSEKFKTLYYDCRVEVKVNGSKDRIKIKIKIDS